MSGRRLRVLVNGVVQGVGFRPFIYRLAHRHELGGTVRNRGDAGVEIELEGAREAIDAFLQALEADAPPLARIDSVGTEEEAPLGTSGFVILPSTEDAAGSGLLPPDIAICDACVHELLEESRFRGYWATSCTDCGPRFTVIDGLPYDRPKTSMRDFPMCSACEREYTDPLDRRYHAQTTACAACGPQLSFDGRREGALDQAIDALRAGRILAIKGIGGTHIACNAMDDDLVQRLREKLGRPTQPLALMELEERLPAIAQPTEEEWTLLRSPQRPIVLLQKRADVLPETIAPGLHNVGIMLPYSGLHHLLLTELGFPLVMTSGNMPGRPMLIDNDAIKKELGGIVDHMLLHDRTIVARCDDSVQRLVAGSPLLLRRSRGYVPQAITGDLGKDPMLALGPETDLTFALYADGRVIPSQHIGNVDDLEVLDALTDAIDHLYAITRADTPRLIVCDAHPEFLTTELAMRFAKKYGAERIQVQHHVAHFASVLVEHELDRAVGVILDGYGYGTDGTAWGGEFFIADGGRIGRTGCLRQVPMAGGDLAAKNPLRMAAAYLIAGGAPIDRVERTLAERGVATADASVLLQQLARRVNAPMTSSCGRFLDAVAAWSGVCRERTYEGEPAMKLEAAARAGQPSVVLAGESFVCATDGGYELDVAGLFTQLVEHGERLSTSDLAATAQQILAEQIADIAIRLAKTHKMSAVALSGGVAYNESITSAIAHRLEREELSLHRNVVVPSGDGGVSFGQLAAVGRYRDSLH